MPVPLPGANIESLIENLEKVFSIASFYPFISYIRFPNYKSINSTTRLTFSFPITVILGKNGTNKSSILQAIYGAPTGYSTGHYWFSTDLDPIEDNDRGQARFVYSYFIPEIGHEVEVINTRVGVSKGADYWEPARPRLGDNMSPMPPYEEKHKKFRSKTRWNSMKKPSLVLDFRSEISAYDRAFNYLDRRPTKLIVTAQDFIRRRSKNLKEVIENNLKSYVLNGKERVYFNYSMDATELAWAEYIIGKKYSEIRIVEHSLFDSRSISVYLKSSIKYSEALAGSGETAICSFIHKIYNSKDRSLILLDEPEVSLHPGAQKRFVEFLLVMSAAKKHQFIISSHSPNIIEGLPKKSLRLAKADVSGVVDIFENISKDEVFVDIEAKTNKIKLYCEDATMQGLINRLKRPNSELISDYIEVLFLSGGADAMKHRYIGGSFEKLERDTYYLIDGDKKSGDMPDPDNIPPGQNEDLKSIIDSALGCSLFVEFNSNTSQDDRFMKYRKFMKYYNMYVSYFPYLNPEAMIIQEILVKDQKYIEALKQKKIKDKIYSSALLYYGLPKISNAQVEAFITYQMGQIDDYYEFLPSMIDFLEKVITGKGI